MADWQTQWQQKLHRTFDPRYRELRAQIQHNPYYRLQSWQEIPIAAELGFSLDVNRATLDDWLRLPGISIHQARSLVGLISSGGQLLCLEDLAAALGVNLSQVVPLAPILSFTYYDPESWAAPQRLNPNTTTLAELQQLPLLTANLARRIVKERQHGPYRDIADLQQRLALSGHFTTQLMYYLRF